MSIRRYLTRKNFREALTSPRFRRKVINYARCRADMRRQSSVVKSFPANAVLNTTNLCNLRCRFCEIHYFYKKAKEVSGQVFPNHIDTRLLQDHHEWLQRAISVHLSGATGEPFTNPHILDVIRHLKGQDIRLSLDTNGLLIDENVAKELVRNKFDALSVSIHAGDSQTYACLQGGDFGRVIGNLRDLIKLKGETGSSYPKVGINFALNRENAHSAKDLMKIARDIGVDSFSLYHYYASRNALGKDISFYSDTKSGNARLKDCYEYAREIGLAMTPASPLYLSDYSETSPGDRAPAARRCYAPWTSIKFKGCVEYENCEYLGVCNRILLFRMDYGKFYQNKRNGFARNIWNHPLLQYLRETVNSGQSNPVCRFCKDADTPKIRCLDNVEYARRRDTAVRSFFAAFRKRHHFEEVDGLTVLADNPYEYDAKDGF